MNDNHMDQLVRDYITYILALHNSNEGFTIYTIRSMIKDRWGILVPSNMVVNAMFTMLQNGMFTYEQADNHLVYRKAEQRKGEW